MSERTVAATRENIFPKEDAHEIHAEMEVHYFMARTYDRDPALVPVTAYRDQFGVVIDPKDEENPPLILRDMDGMVMCVHYENLYDPVELRDGNRIHPVRGFHHDGKKVYELDLDQPVYDLVADFFEEVKNESS